MSFGWGLGCMQFYVGIRWTCLCEREMGNVEMLYVMVMYEVLFVWLLVWCVGGPGRQHTADIYLFGFLDVCFLL